MRVILIVIVCALAVAGVFSLAQSPPRLACGDVALALAVLSLGGFGYAVVDAGVFETPEQLQLLEGMWRQLFGLHDTPLELSVPFGMIRNWPVPTGAVEIFASRAGLAGLLLAVPAQAPPERGSS